MSPPAAPEIAVQDLGIDLGGRRILEGVDAVFSPGRFTGIVGPNGAGKSTLVRACLGLLPPATGRVLIGGSDVRSLSRREMARRVAFVPQDTHVEFAFRVQEVVAMGRYPHLDPLEREGPADRAAVSRAMEVLELDDIARRRVTALSGGERQRVFIARALATDAPALLLDEPISSLDVGHRLDILSFLARLASEGKAVVAVLHDIELALRFCDPLIVLAGGRAVACGPPGEILAGPRLEAVFGVRVEKVAGDGGPLVRFHRVRGSN